MSKTNKKYKTRILESDKFRMKCQKKFKFLKEDRYEKNNFDTLCNIIDDLIAEINNKMDIETINRIKSHPDRLIYHANNILKISHNIEFKQNKQKLNELKVVIEQCLNEINSKLSFHDFRMVKGETNTSLIFDTL